MLPQMRKCPMPSFGPIGPPIGAPKRSNRKKRTYNAAKENDAIMFASGQWKVSRRYIYGTSLMKIGPLFFIKMEGQKKNFFNWGVGTTGNRRKKCLTHQWPYKFKKHQWLYHSLSERVFFIRHFTSGCQWPYHGPTNRIFF